jgi:formate--tetrahydrofolate ligase
VQTLEGTPALIHGGPFANIAHGCNSVIATKTALSLADYTVTEAGFGSDLGAEKFLDIKCRLNGLSPACVVLVATVRALKMHGGVKKTELEAENIPALERGLPNLLRHAENLRDVYGLPTVIAINRFGRDTETELEALQVALRERGFDCELCEAHARGGEGAEALARAVVAAGDRETALRFAYPLDVSIEEKLRLLTQRVYHGADVILSDTAKKQSKQLEDEGYAHLPVCVAKTQYSFSDDSAKTGAPEGFKLNVRSLRLCAGAGFIVALAGEIMTMPGLPKKPAAENIGIDDSGRITGLF